MVSDCHLGKKHLNLSRGDPLPRRPGQVELGIPGWKKPLQEGEEQGR